jgi:hypothetical protein
MSGSLEKGEIDAVAIKARKSRKALSVGNLKIMFGAKLKLGSKETYPL